MSWKWDLRGIDVLSSIDISTCIVWPCPVPINAELLPGERASLKADIKTRACPPWEFKVGSRGVSE